MKRILKWMIGLVVLLIVGLFVWAWFKSEPLPKGVEGKEADLLAEKMLKSLNYDAYKNTRFLEWSFRNNQNQYKWDKENGSCEIKWKDFDVSLNLANPEKSSVLKNGQKLSGTERSKIIAKASGYFNNDSFWLVAPFKVFDAGTRRFLVSNQEGEKGLLVTYSKGGSTPGDSYLWLLNENGFPNSFKMWVSVIPIGGLEASWDDWLVTESGAFLPKTHEFGPLEFDMGQIKAYND